MTRILGRDISTNRKKCVKKTHDLNPMLFRKELLSGFPYHSGKKRRDKAILLWENMWEYDVVEDEILEDEKRFSFVEISNQVLFGLCLSSMAKISMANLYGKNQDLAASSHCCSAQALLASENIIIWIYIV